MSGASCSLNEVCDQATLLGRFSLPLRETDLSAARTAAMEVRVTRCWLPSPQHATPWLKMTGIGAIASTVIEVREVSVPAGVAALRWVLFTDEHVETLDDAQRILGDHEQRWLIEEVHNALKTGCRLESRQYQTRARLEALTGLLSVVAVRLVQLKHAANVKPDEPAEVRVPREWLTVLRSLSGAASTNSSSVSEATTPATKSG